MAQKTNLNVSPYYDDFDSSKNYYKVLYKPGFPIQARELTTSQSILQGQVQNFGNNIFKDGSVVIPGGIAYDGNFRAVKLKSVNYGTDISVYIKSFIGKKIVGQVSGITATIKHVEFIDNTNVYDTTIYVTYLSSGNDSQLSSFTDGEQLSCTENVTYGNTTINAGIPFASLTSSQSTKTGSAAYISKGVYFIRGYFVNVEDQTLVLDYYTNNPSYRVGLRIDELLVSAKDDDTLYDNAKGFSNYAAPGADRLKINLTLTKKLLTDQNDTDFVELMRVDNGKIKLLKSKSQYNIVRDWIAERTYDESGNYTTEPFSFSVHNSLNDNLGNGGLYFKTDKTEQLNTPSDDLMCLRVSAGKAYVRGYDVEKVGSTIIDVEKPRDVGIRSDVSVNFNMGSILKVNTVSGSAKQGGIVELYSDFGSTGHNIGSARAYGFNLHDSAYSDNETIWDLRLFDIQTNTEITLNQSIGASELPKGSYVKGKYSNSSGYSIKDGSNSKSIILNQTSGNFVKGEPIQINGIDYPGIVGVSTSYNTQSIKSVKQLSSSGYPEFKANSHLEKFRLPNNVVTVKIESNGGGISTVTSGGIPFSGLRKGSTVRYIKPGEINETYNKVQSVGLGGTCLVVESISGVTNGLLPTTDINQVSMFAGAPIISGDGILHAPLANKNVSTINLDNSSLKVTKQITGRTIATNSSTITIPNVQSQYSEIDSATFEPFDQERYSVHYSNGTIGSLNTDSFQYQNSGEQITLTNLTDGTNVLVNTSINKKGIKSKLKDYNRSEVINVTYSKYKKSGSVSVGNGAAAVADGLIYDKRYGLRVQDEEISLNYPDVSKFLAVYESIDSNTPTLDILQFTSTVDVQTNAIIGENIYGNNNNVIARIVSKPSANNLAVVYLTSDKFSINDSVSFTESSITTNIENIDIGLYKNITNSFALNKGQKDQYYDYSSIVRNKNAKEPSGQLLIVVDYYTVKNGDEGDVFTSASYDIDRYSTDIPNIGVDNTRATDTIDFRPRVPAYNPSVNTGSPFEFSSRDFSNSISQYIIPNESSILGYSYYLPRIDKVYLNKFGEFVYEKGQSSPNPKSPVRVDNVMELATIKLPPYLYNPQDAFLSFVDNKRFTMRDIGSIEGRVSNLEEVTTLSLLESSAQSLQIQDSEGRNRFKSGFFVDSFKDSSLINKSLSSLSVNSRAQEITPFRSRDTLVLLPSPKESTISSELDLGHNYELFDGNVQKTGDAITLKYKEVEWLTQVYATEIINVNPYELPAIGGHIQLEPQTDTWTRSIQLEDNVIRQSGVNRTDNLNISLAGDLDLGDITLNTSTNRTVIDPPSSQFVGTRESSDSSTSTGTLQLSGSDSLTLSNTDTFSQNRLISSATDDFIRSRNIQYTSSGYPEYTRLYLYMDGQEITDVIPKLLQITTESNGSISGSLGSFTIGEEVHALDSDGNVIMKFRINRPDHKTGRWNNPDSIYPSDPYSRGVDTIPTEYSSTSKFINVDTRSLAEEAQGSYFGYVNRNSRLIGQESGATAYVKNLELITDSYGDLTGSLFLKNPYTQPSPTLKINTGVKTFILTTSSENRQVPAGQDPNVIIGQTNYTAIGTVEEWQNDVTITTNTNTINANVNASINGSVTVTQRNRETVRAEYTDPLAQTFVVGGNILAPSALNGNDDFNGAFITSVGVFFASIDTVTSTPVRCEIREVVGDARPSRIIKGKSVTLYPTKTDANGNTVNNIEFDPDNASKETKFTFPEPIYLEAGKSYAVVLLAERSVHYTVWTGRHGDVAVNPQSIPGASNGAILRYSSQYGSGSIFKSQNGALWTEDQSQDMTFKLYKAEFTSLSGTAFFTNPDLDESNGFVPTLRNNPLNILPKTGSIGIKTITTADSINYNILSPILTSGRKICGNKLTSTSVIDDVGGFASSVNITDVGSRYVTDSEVDTFAITGKGSGLKLNIDGVNSDGEITSINASLPANGTGYKVGDVVGIVTSTVSDGQGIGAKITITQTGGIDTLYLTDIQGQSSSYPVGYTLRYFDNNDNVVSLATTTILSNNNFNNGGVNSGNYFSINQFNHGMHSNTNKILLDDIETDVSPTTLSSPLSQNETATISVASTSQFVKFEGVEVGVANTGYVKIENEIIGYQDVGNGVLNIANVSGNKRGVDGTIAIQHPEGIVVKKHEVGGVSLRRFEIDNLSINNDDLDNYYVSFNREKNGLSRNIDTTNIPQLSFKNNSEVGGSNVKASKNILYSALVPRFNVDTPTGVNGATTNISGSIRTVTGTSVSGLEPSFDDNGYEPIQINSYNELDSVRVVASKTNENQYLTNLPRNKSFTAALTLSTSDKNISPIIWWNTSEIEFVNSRLNNPVGIDNYDIDGRVNSILDDPHAAVYVSNTVRLKKPGTSLRVLLNAYRHSSSDIRVLYNLIKTDSSEIEETFQLFPGYKNLIDNDEDGFGDIVVDEIKNDGRSDSIVTPSLKNEYKEYQYTADNLPEFIGYTIKIVMSGTNQAESPRIRQLRTIAVR